LRDQSFAVEQGGQEGGGVVGANYFVYLKISSTTIALFASFANVNIPLTLNSQNYLIIALSQEIEKQIYKQKDIQ
jgi:hypothetical protein